MSAYSLASRWRRGLLVAFTLPFWTLTQPAGCRNDDKRTPAVPTSPTDGGSTPALDSGVEPVGPIARDRPVDAAADGP